MFLRATLVIAFVFLLSGIYSTQVWANIEVHPRLFLQEEYTDNLFLTKNDRESDWISTIAPGINLRYDGRSIDVLIDIVLHTYSIEVLSNEILKESLFIYPKGLKMKVFERNIQVRKTSLKIETDDLKNTTPKERWEMMWQIAQDAWAFNGETVAEPGFQRHIIRVYRRES